MTPKTTFRAVADQLARIRKDLLDLGLRNPLLNFRQPRGKGLDVSHPRAESAFRLLVKENKSFTFRSSDESPHHHRFSPAEDLEFLTSLPRQQLEARLLATYYAARTSIEEQGVNTLFLAFGMLSWKEEAGDKAYRAPLILVPVELVRTDARCRFTLCFNGDDFGENVSLAEKLRLEFGLKFPKLPADEELEPSSYFQSVRKAIQSKEDWAVDNGAMVIGFFSFSRFLMYRDLDPETWADGEILLGHPLLNSLMGDSPFASLPPEISEESHLDEALTGREPLLVDNADSSQVLALVEALAGHNLVIQGPPGTGKSQTIVNLIAAAVNAGKKVLFVSEKIAALEVVKRRLDNLQLGACCLELHSNKTKKRELIGELRRTAYMARIQMPTSSAQIALLADHRNSLNSYCTAVNSVILQSDETPSCVYGKLLLASRQLEGLEIPQVRLTDALKWTSEDVARKRAVVERLRSAAAQSGPRSFHAYRGSHKRTYVPTERESLARELKHICHALDNFATKATELADLFRVAPSDTFSKIGVLVCTAKLVARSPDLDGIDVQDNGWLEFSAAIREVAGAGQRMQIARSQFGSALIPSAWDRDVSELKEVAAASGAAWWRWFSPKWRQAKKIIATLCAGVAPRDSEVPALLDAIVQDQRGRLTIEQHASRLAGLAGSGWRGSDTDFGLLRARLEWIVEAKASIQAETASSWCLTADLPKAMRIAIQASLTAVEESSERATSTIRRWRQIAEFDAIADAMSDLDQQPIREQIGYYMGLYTALDSFSALVRYNQAAHECQNSGLQKIVEAADDSCCGAEAILPLFEKARLEPLIEYAFVERPVLGEFDGARQDRTVDAFRRLDQAQLRFDRAALAARHSASVPALSAVGQAGVLAKEFERKARFLPIRKLMENAGNAVQAIKPVFMMSPLSIANYLPPGTVEFDMAIFDEASQVKPAEALGAIVRAKQVVVVGDSKQLPPTNFFDAMIADGPSEADEEETAADDIESILGLFCSRGAPQKMLLWHYRSRHESLIAVSNRLFYERLIIFPSPERDRPELGLKFRHLPNAFYERGGRRINPVEAKAVAEAVFDHARKQVTVSLSERETLGVVAFSVAQMDAIRAELEILRKTDSSQEEFFTPQHSEPFFVKNLENVQGDERDVILISIGYGRTADGYLAMSFGPLNRAGGERRLNVIISRARKRCVVFTNLTADDIDLGRAPSKGVEALKTFLSYAQTGRMDISTPTGRGADSEFEEQVAAALVRNGYTVETQVGCSGFFLDMAVVDASRPGRYVLGIECDGAAYHRARSARDRDRLRQAVLEGLGWNIYRIWSTDWFRDPEVQLRKLLEAIEQVKCERGDSTRPEEKVEIPSEFQPAPEMAPHPSAFTSATYEFARLDIRLGNVELHLVPIHRLAEWLVLVTRVESPIHWLEAARRVAAAAGVQRVGNRIQQAMNAAVESAVSQGRLHRRGEFLWDLTVTRPIVRDRSLLPPSSRRIDLVAPDEIASAVVAVVQNSFGMAFDEIPAAVGRSLGFARVSEETRGAVEGAARALIESGRLELRGRPWCRREDDYQELWISGNSLMQCFHRSPVDRFRGHGVYGAALDPALRSGAGAEAGGRKITICHCKAGRIRNLTVLANDAKERG